LSFEGDMDDSYSARVAELKQQAARLQRDKEAVVAGLQKVIADAQRVIRELTDGLSRGRGRGRSAGAAKRRGPKRAPRFSAAARKKISLAQKRRWARARKAKAAA
jgi:hypothetical protein